MHNNISPSNFLSSLKDRNFSTEEELERYCLEFLPDLLKIDNNRFSKQQLTTPFDYTLSNRSDLLIYSVNDPDQVIVTIEIKLEKSIQQFDMGSYEKSIRQLHKYCQDLNSLYGILLSDKECKIFEYKYNGSDINPLSINSLPPVGEIEKELLKNAKLHDLSRVARGIEELKKLQRKNSKNEKLDTYRNSNEVKSKTITEIQKPNFWIKNKPFEVFSISMIAIIFFWLAIIFIKQGHLINTENTPQPLTTLSISSCDLIRGNVSLNIDGTIGDMIYHIPGSKSYDSVKLKSTDGDQCFRTEQEALDAGFRKSKAY